MQECPPSGRNDLCGRACFARRHDWFSSRNQEPIILKLRQEQRPGSIQAVFKLQGVAVVGWRLVDPQHADPVQRIFGQNTLRRLYHHTSLGRALSCGPHGDEQCPDERLRSLGFPSPQALGERRWGRELHLDRHIRRGRHGTLYLVALLRDGLDDQSAAEFLDTWLKQNGAILDGHCEVGGICGSGDDLNSLREGDTGGLAIFQADIDRCAIKEDGACPCGGSG